MLNKKAQGMPMNVVIIAIIVLVVLIVIIVFFVGGFAGLSAKLRDLFSGSTSGQQKDIVIQTCQNLCESAGSLPETSKQESGYCTQTFLVDHDSNAETKPLRMGCSKDPGTDALNEDDKRRGITKTGSLNFACESVTC